MFEVDRVRIDDDEIVDYKSERMSNEKDFVDFIVNLVADPLLFIELIRIEDDGDKDCWDRYQEYFYNKNDFLAEYENICSHNLHRIIVKGVRLERLLSIFAIVDKKTVRVSESEGFNYKEYFESLGY